MDPPVFVGGMQRSGTHALGNLIGQHSRYEMVPRELAFHVAPAGEGGVPDLLAGRITLDGFVERMRTHWWSRGAPWDPGVERGLHKSIPEERHRDALARLEQADPRDPVSAVRAFIHELLDPIAAEAGARAWVEMDPTNILAARELHQLFPGMKLVHTIRDGRDVACSLERLPWGGEKLRHNVAWWERTLREADAIVRELPPGTVLVMQLEDLVVNDRDRSYRRLLDFLELDDEPQMREFFETFLKGSTEVLLIVSRLVMLVAGVSILVSIYNSVSARMREIAILRALGATRGRVLTLICTEAAVIGFLGAVLGLIVGHLIGAIESGYFQQTLGQTIDWFRVSSGELSSLALAVVIAAVAGLVPAMKAYRTPVAVNLVS